MNNDPLHIMSLLLMYMWNLLDIVYIAMRMLRHNNLLYMLLWVYLLHMRNLLDMMYILNDPQMNWYISQPNKMCIQMRLLLHNNHHYMISVLWLDQHIVSLLDMLYNQLDPHMHRYPVDMVHMW
jgi:hypothetical protein